MKFDVGWSGGVSIYNFFEILKYIDYYNVEDYIFYIREDINTQPGAIDEKLLMIKNIFETYDYFFHHNIKFPEIEVNKLGCDDDRNGFFESKNHFKEWKEYWRQSANKDFWKIKSPNPNKKYVTISFINNKRNSKKYFQYVVEEGRTIQSEYVDFLLDNLCRDDNVKNLGDSRKFKTSQELIEKIEFIEQSKFYIGSKCSWKDIARIFEIPTLIIEEYKL
jgi:hypothetical protein